MFEGLFQPMHLLVIVGIALLVFGPKKLPELGKGIGEGIRGFKAAINDEEKPASTTTSTIANNRSVTKGWSHANHIPSDTKPGWSGIVVTGANIIWQTCDTGDGSILRDAESNLSHALKTVFTNALRCFCAVRAVDTTACSSELEPDFPGTAVKTDGAERSKSWHQITDDTFYVGRPDPHAEMRSAP
jgi:sec-independent protein translocase protein TatA